MRVQIQCISLYEEQRQKLELLAGGKRHFSKVVRQLIDEAAQSARLELQGRGAKQAPMKSTSVRTTNQNAGAGE